MHVMSQLTYFTIWHDSNVVADITWLAYKMIQIMAKNQCLKSTSFFKSRFSSKYFFPLNFIISHKQVLVQFSSVARSCLTLCNSMNYSTPGLSVHHQLPESTQTHVYWVSDAIQPSHPLPFPSPPSLNLSQHQGLFQWVSSFASGGQSIGVSASTSVLPMNTQDWSPLGWTGWISLQSKGLSRGFFNTTVQKHQFFGTQLSL